MLARIETGITRVRQDVDLGKRLCAVRQINHDDIVIGENASFERLPVDVTCIGVGHEDLTGLDGGPIAAKDGELPIARFDGLRFGVLENAHSPLLQGATKTTQEFAWAKTAAEAIENPSRIDVPGYAAARLQLPSGKQFEERSPLVPKQRHQRTEVAFLHEIIRTLQALQVSRHCGGG